MNTNDVLEVLESYDNLLFMPDSVFYSTFQKTLYTAEALGLTGFTVFLVDFSGVSHLWADEQWIFYKNWSPEQQQLISDIGKTYSPLFLEKGFYLVKTPLTGVEK